MSLSSTLSEVLDVPAHTTNRLTIFASGGDWTFTFARTGCVRVQRGDFTAYIPREAVAGLAGWLNQSTDVLADPVVDFAKQASGDEVEFLVPDLDYGHYGGTD